MCSYGNLYQLLLLPLAVPSTVETHTEKPLRWMGAAMLGSAITTQYSTVEFMPSMTARFLGGSIQILTPVQLVESK